MTLLVENIIGPLVIAIIILLPLLIYCAGTLMCNSILFLGHHVHVSPFAIALSASLNYRRTMVDNVDYCDFLDDPRIKTPIAARRHIKSAELIQGVI